MKVDVLAHSASSGVNDIHEPFAGEVSMEYERLGCLHSSSDETSGDLRDLKCMDAKADANATCRGGLPFFNQKVEPSGAVEACFRFCVSKALDLFGISVVTNTEGILVKRSPYCRCGASSTNEAIWGQYLETSMSRGLQLNMSDVKMTSEDDSCDGTQVFRYIGWLEREQSEGVPWVVIQASPEDVAYVDSIVQGKTVAAVKSHTSIVEQKGDLWPAPGAAASAAAAGRVVVTYSFNFVDPLAKRMFWRAAQEWNYRTVGCIRFVETKGAAELEVNNGDQAACGPAAMGYPGKGKVGQLQLGGCDDQRKLDLVVHALAGVLGFDVPLGYGGQGALSPEHTNGILEAYKCPVQRTTALL